METIILFVLALCFLAVAWLESVNTVSGASRNLQLTATLLLQKVKLKCQQSQMQ